LLYCSLILLKTWFPRRFIFISSPEQKNASGTTVPETA